MSFVSKVIATRRNQLHEVQAQTADGRDVYCLLRVEPRKEQKFEAALATGSLDLAEYGTILASCYGKEPPEGMKKEIERRFGLKYKE